MSAASTPIYVRATASWIAERTEGHALQPPAAELLPTRARGRASLLTRMIAEVVARAAHAGGADLHTTPLLVGSALGEIDTTLQLLKMMNEGDGALSPARFQASVHNAAAGQLSIATGNQGFSSCLAAGESTAAALLIEAYAWLTCEGGSLLVVMADESVPALLQQSEPFEAAACALLLCRGDNPDENADALATLCAPVSVPVPCTRGGAEAEPSIAGPTPVAHMLRVIDLAEHARTRGDGVIELPSGSRAIRIDVRAPTR